MEVTERNRKDEYSKTMEKHQGHEIIKREVRLNDTLTIHRTHYFKYYCSAILQGPVHTTLRTQKADELGKGKAGQWEHRVITNIEERRVLWKVLSLWS
jgi:hypothetical protein